MQAFVPLPYGLSAEKWRDRYRRGEVPDRSPYGLHQLEDHGITPDFDTVEFGRPLGRLAASVRYRTSGVELVEGVAHTRTLSRSKADVVLSYDERTGIPASLLATKNSPPTVTGIGWLTTRGRASRAMRQLAPRALSRAAAVWSQCAPVLPVLGREWNIAPSRLHFVPLGIDSTFYGIQPLPERTGVIASAGEDRFRDHDLLIAAVREARRTHPEALLELATGLPVDFSPDLGSLHTGRLDGRMRDVYRRASIVAVALHPTITGSGLTVMLEAMASGRPVVATANPGISDYIDHGETGLLVPPNDVGAFANALRELLDDPERGIAMGELAAHRVRERFTTSIMAAELACLMKSV